MNIYHSKAVKSVIKFSVSMIYEAGKEHQEYK